MADKAPHARRRHLPPAQRQPAMPPKSTQAHHTMRKPAPANMSSVPQQPQGRGKRAPTGPCPPPSHGRTKNTESSGYYGAASAAAHNAEYPPLVPPPPQQQQQPIVQSQPTAPIRGQFGGYAAAGSGPPPALFPPARTRSTPPTTAEQQQSQQMYRFMPHKSAAPSFIAGSHQRLAYQQIPMTYQQPVTYQYPYDARNSDVLPAHIVVQQQQQQHQMYPVNMIGRSQSHFPTNMHSFPSAQRAPMQRPAPPPKRESHALVIMNPETGKPISLDSPSKKSPQPHQPESQSQEKSSTSPTDAAAGDGAVAEPVQQQPSVSQTPPLQSLEQESPEIVQVVQQETPEAVKVGQQETPEAVQVVQQETPKAVKVVQQETPEAVQVIQQETPEAVQVVQQETPKAVQVVQQETPEAVQVIQQETPEAVQVVQQEPSEEVESIRQETPEPLQAAEQPSPESVPTVERDAVAEREIPESAVVEPEIAEQVESLDEVVVEQEIPEVADVEVVEETISKPVEAVERSSPERAVRSPEQEPEAREQVEPAVEKMIQEEVVEDLVPAIPSVEEVAEVSAIESKEPAAPVLAAGPAQEQSEETALATHERPGETKQLPESHKKVPLFLKRLQAKKDAAALGVSIPAESLLNQEESGRDEAKAVSTTEEKADSAVVSPLGTPSPEAPVARRYEIDELLALKELFTDLPSDLSPSLQCLKSSRSNRSDSSHFGMGDGRRSSSFRPGPSVDSGFSTGADSMQKRSKSFLDNNNRERHRYERSDRSQGSFRDRDRDRGQGSFRDRDRGQGSFRDRERGQSRRRKSTRGQGRAGQDEDILIGPVEPLALSDNRWQPVQVSDEFQKVKRKVKGILNKLTVDKFEFLSVQFLEKVQSHVTNQAELTEIVEVIFDKALLEPSFSKMYSELCDVVAKGAPSVASESNPPKEKQGHVFKRLLLNQCQREFERGLVSIEPTKDQTEEEVEQLQHKQKLRFLGNIQFIGELFKLSMITEKIMHQCVKNLLADVHDPEIEDLEALCKLLTTIGKTLDHPRAKSHMNAYFQRMRQLAANENLPARIRFLVKDVIDLRASHWRPRRKKMEAKSLKEIHQDAEKEREEKESRSRRDRGGSSSGFTLARHQTAQLSFRDHRSHSGDVRRDRVSLKNDRYSRVGRASVSGESISSAGTNLQRTSTAPLTSIPKAAPKPSAPAKSAKQIIDSLIKEFFQGGDIVQAKNCLTDIPNVESAENKRLIASRLFNLAVECKSSDRPNAIRLLLYFLSERVISDVHAIAGLKEISECLSDIAVDAPFVSKYLGEILASLIADGHCSLDTLYDLAFKQQISNGHFQRFVSSTLHALSIQTGQMPTRARVVESGFDILPFLEKPFRSDVQKFVADQKLDWLFGDLSVREEIWEVLESGKSLMAWLESRVPSLTSTSSVAMLRAIMEFVLLRPNRVEAEAHELRQLLSANADALRLLRRSAQTAFPLLHETHKLIDQLQHPKGLALQTFSALHELDIVDAKAFALWRRDASERFGKLEVLAAVQKRLERMAPV